MNRYIYFFLICCTFSCSGDEESYLDFSSTDLFQAERSGEKILFYIPDSLLGRDMLLVSRFAGVPENYHQSYAAGSEFRESLLYWEKKGDYILLRARNARSTTPADDPLSLSVQANSTFPVLERFKIKSSLSGDSYKVNVSSFFNTSSSLLSGWYKSTAKEYDKNKFEDENSWLESFKAFENNIELSYIKTYSVGKTPHGDGTATMSFKMHYSLVLLSEKPMASRYHDPRIGWFSV
ncbi:MAG: DUF5117 domain-containing protein, partial [Cyanobacteria bacterium J06649_11]